MRVFVSLILVLVVVLAGACESTVGSATTTAAPVETMATSTTAATTSPSNTAVSSDLVIVPNLIGMTLEEAASVLGSFGLMVVFQQVNSTVPADTVVAQDPLAGTQANPGSTITMQVSSGQ